MEKKNFKTLVLSGGNVKGYAYIGAYEYLKEKNILKDAETFVCNSIGSLFGLLIVLDYSPFIMKRIFYSLDIEKIKKYNINTFFDSFGLDNKRLMEKFVKILISSKNLDENLTLKQLFDLTGKNLVLTSSNVVKKETEFLSYESFPGMPVYFAVCASMSIPIIFSPSIYNNLVLVDGFLTSNLPVEYLKNNPEKDYSDVLCLVLKTEKTEKELFTELKSLENYIYSILKCSINQLESNSMKEIERNNYDVIIYYCKTTTNMNFNLSQEEIENLRILGYNTTKKYFS